MKTNVWSETLFYGLEEDVKFRKNSPALMQFVLEYDGRVCAKNSGLHVFHFMIRHSYIGNEEDEE